MEIEYNLPQIIAQLKSKDVYKDECTMCFTENTDQNGIDVCLTCFEGFCSKKKHSKHHSELTGHKLFARYTNKVIKTDLNKESTQKITKMAIGMEGGIDASNTITETTVRLINFNQENEDYIVLEGQEDLFSVLINLDSAYKKEDVRAWEAEIKTCQHTREMVQLPDVNVDSGGLVKCSKCELNSNLWICLTCGELSCGRKFYDGTGGNGHAVQHYETTGHPIAVKSGTISPEGNASIFCYSCDDDVKDEALPAHLQNIGIDVMDMSKTEKTMTELNLAANLNLTLSSNYEKGKKLEPVFGPCRTGLENIGNSCYLASVLQVLLHIPELKKRYLQAGAEHLKVCKRSTPKCFMCQMSKLVHGLCSGEYSIEKTEEIEVPATGEKTIQKYQDGIKPFMIRKLVGEGHFEFSTKKQQDAMEYLIHFLSVLEKNEKNFKLTPSSDLFKFELETRYQCLCCKKYKVNSIDSKFITLPVPSHPNFDSFGNSTPVEEQQYTVKLEDCIKEFTKPTQVQMVCTGCEGSGSQPFEKTVCLRTFPQYLVVQAENFKLNGWVPLKLHCTIDFGNYSDFDVKSLSLPAIAEGERFVESEEEVQQVQVDPEALGTLMGMGFSENRCKRALIECGNNAENAINYIFSTMDDMTQEEPLEPKKKSSSSGGSSQQDPKALLLQQVLLTSQAMGISDEIAGLACEFKDSPDAVVNYIFENMDTLNALLVERKNSKPDFQDTQMMKESKNDPNSSNYGILGSVVHLGKSVHVGHYVAYARQQQDWIYFNDSKVSKSENSTIGDSYIYLLEKQSQ